jgi:hypothetical protein
VKAHHVSIFLLLMIFGIIIAPNNFSDVFAQYMGNVDPSGKTGAETLEETLKTARTEFLKIYDPDGKNDPQHYVNRYLNEREYKEWFDRNWGSKYKSIYEAVGLPDFYYYFKERWNWNGSSHDSGKQGEFSSPNYIAIDSKDFVYVGDSANRIQKFSKNGDFVTEWRGPSSPWNIEINSKDEVYARWGPHGEVVKLSPDGKIIETWGTAKSGHQWDHMIDLSGESGINFFIDRFDNLYFSENTIENSRTKYESKVLKYSPDGVLLTAFTNMAKPRAQDKDGNLYAIGDCSVIKYNSIGAKIGQFGRCGYREGVGTFSDITDIEVDSNDLVYVVGAQGWGGSITVFRNDGTIFGSIGGYGINEQQYRSPVGIAINSQNDVYFTDRSGHSVFIYSPRPPIIEYRHINPNAPECGIGTVLENDMCVVDQKFVKQINDQKFEEIIQNFHNNLSIDTDSISRELSQVLSKYQNSPEKALKELAPLYKKIASQQIAQIDYAKNMADKRIDSSNFPTEDRLEYKRKLSDISENMKAVILHRTAEQVAQLEDVLKKEQIKNEILSQSTKTSPRISGGCLVATATYGTELAPQVQLLREIRDNSVFTTNSGAAFMSGFNQFYYSFSPAIADLERQNPIFKKAVKITITPMLYTLSILNYVSVDSEQEMLGYGIGIILLNIGLYFVIPTVLIYKLKNRKS